jgi:hypothetical protein
MIHAQRVWPTPFAAALNSATQALPRDPQPRSREIVRGLKLVPR